MIDYAVYIRNLKPEDMNIYGTVTTNGKIDGTSLSDALGDIPLEECLAISGEDLGECLAAVIHAVPNAPKPLLWADEQLTSIADGFQFADAAMVVTLALQTPEENDGGS